MARIWANQIEAENKFFSQCPARYKAQVLAVMRQDVEDGKITEEQFEELTGVPYEQ